jgi:hypothetical protein
MDLANEFVVREYLRASQSLLEVGLGNRDLSIVYENLPQLEPAIVLGQRLDDIRCTDDIKGIACFSQIDLLVLCLNQFLLDLFFGYLDGLEVDFD